MKISSHITETWTCVKFEWVRDVASACDLKVFLSDETNLRGRTGQRRWTPINDEHNINGYGLSLRMFEQTRKTNSHKTVLLKMPQLSDSCFKCAKQNAERLSPIRSDTFRYIPIHSDTYVSECIGGPFCETFVKNELRYIPIHHEKTTSDTFRYIPIHHEKKHSCKILCVFSLTQLFSNELESTRPNLSEPKLLVQMPSGLASILLIVDADDGTFKTFLSNVLPRALMVSALSFNSTALYFLATPHLSRISLTTFFQLHLICDWMVRRFPDKGFVNASCQMLGVTTLSTSTWMSFAAE